MILVGICSSAGPAFSLVADPHFPGYSPPPSSWCSGHLVCDPTSGYTGVHVIQVWLTRILHTLAMVTGSGMGGSPRWSPPVGVLRGQEANEELLVALMSLWGTACRRSGLHRQAEHRDGKGQPVLRTAFELPVPTRKPAPGLSSYRRLGHFRTQESTFYRPRIGETIDMKRLEMWEGGRPRDRASLNGGE